MSDELTQTWDEISTNWDKWGQPLRPAPEDIGALHDSIIKWQTPEVLNKTNNVLLLGVTPEIANTSFPFKTKLTAIDQSQGMIDNVWPGDVPDTRSAILGDWFNMPIDSKSQDIVLGDGVFVFFNPDDMDKLAASIANSMTDRGLFVVRQFVMPSKKEAINKLVVAISEGKVSNFHIFKFRVGMALQANLIQGVSQNDIWKEATRIITYIDPRKKLTNLDKSTLDFYKDKTATMHFPTVEEFKTILSKYFSSIEVHVPTYDFGECCPTFSMRLK